MEASNHLRSFMAAQDNLIKEMPWEGAAMGALGVSLSQLRYAVAMFAAVPLASGVRLFKSPTSV